MTKSDEELYNTIVEICDGLMASKKGHLKSGKNLTISHADLDFIRSLEDFDLVMLLSDINDHGWEVASRTLSIMRESLKAAPRRR